MNRSALVAAIRERKSFLCVGLDPEMSKIPPHLLESEDPVFEFNKAIIDATRDLCVAYKPNLAFFEALGLPGWQAFTKTIAYIGDQHLVIADAKRGDIGNTSRLYAQAFFQTYHCDALTIAPYMGRDSVEPFLEFPGKWVILLALTSNPGSVDFQFGKQADTQPLYTHVMKKAMAWGSPENLMFVTGATHPAHFKTIREVAPEHFLLVPGVGAQGGDLRAICENGLNEDVGLLVNSSRGIIFASQGEDFAEKARAAAAVLQNEMADILAQSSVTIQ
jgi:orotidine-5'-phosphate decarboxylase